MDDKTLNLEELTNKIKMLEIENDNLKRELIFHKENEEKLVFQSKILSNVYDAIFVVDENYRIKYCNKALVKLFGWQEEELIEQEFFHIIQGRIDEISKEKILCTLEERVKEFDTADEKHLDGIICYSKDGNKIIVDINITANRDFKGELKGFILSLMDVSDRYKYKDELKRGEEKYRYLYNSIDEGFAILDVIFDNENKPVDYRLIEINPAYEKQTGLDSKNLIGKTAKELKFDPENFWGKVYGQVALTGDPIRFVNKSQALNMWFEVYVFKIDLEKDNRIGVMFNNVTEREIHSRKLEELIKMQDELYLNVSHELKTPLNVIFSANQLIDMYLNKDTIEDKKDILLNYNNNIKQNCYRLTRLINNIVDLSKSNSGLLQLNLNNVNIVAVVESIVQSVSEYIKSKNLKIIFDTNMEEKIIACDTDKIERIMLNLISNAIKFSNPNDQIEVSILSDEEKVEISVKDMGMGIEKQNLDNIFNRFYQEDKSLSRNSEGTGIGLSLIKSLVELHGGNISVESEVNKGSIFRVVLPVKVKKTQKFIKNTDSYSNKIENIKVEFSDIYSI